MRKVYFQCNLCHLFLFIFSENIGKPYNLKTEKSIFVILISYSKYLMMNSGKPIYTLMKDERIYAQKRIDVLFAGSESFIAYPLRIVFSRREPEEGKPLAAMLVSVSKKRFKRANKRNSVKRMVREVFRLHKYRFADVSATAGISLDVAFLYLKDELPSFAEIEKSMLKTINVLTDKLTKKEPDEGNS